MRRRFKLGISLAATSRAWKRKELVGVRRVCTHYSELELELIQTQMAQKPVLRAEVYARALRASQKLERERMFGCARDALDEWAGHERVLEWEALE